MRLNVGMIVPLREGPASRKSSVIRLNKERRGWLLLRQIHNATANTVATLSRHVHAVRYSTRFEKGRRWGGLRSVTARSTAARQQRGQVEPYEGGACRPST